MESYSDEPIGCSIVIPQLTSQDPSFITVMQGFHFATFQSLHPCLCHLVDCSL